MNNPKELKEAISRLLHYNRDEERAWEQCARYGQEPGFELQDDPMGKEVMRTRYCIRREMGACLREPSCGYRGPMQLENDFHVFSLHFDCSKCEMSLIYKGKREPISK